MYIGSALNFLYRIFLFFNSYVSGYLILFLLFFLVFLRKNTSKKNRKDALDKSCVKKSNEPDNFTNDRKLKKKWTIILCFMIALIIALTFSLCPINGQSAGIDSSVFLYIGKQMQHGAVPYRDLFDHKGPLLFFIQYFGLLLSGEKFFGVWIIELACLTVAIYFTYRAIELINNKNIVINFLTVLLSFLVIGLQLFEGGNLTEEYALPAIAFFGYVFLKFLKTGKCTKWETFGAGFAFMAVCLIRINMTGFWIMGLPIIAGILIYKKHFKQLFSYLLWFSLGALVIFLPCLVYLLLTNSFMDMLKYYFIFNFEYAKNYDNGGLLSINQFKSILFFIKLIWPVSLAVIILMFGWLRKIFNKIVKKQYIQLDQTGAMRLVCLLIFCFAFLLATMSAKNFLHYIIVLIPFFAIFLQYLLIQINQCFGRILGWQIPKDTELDYSPRGISILFSLFLLITANLYILPNTLVEMPPDAATDYLRKYTNPKDNVLILGNACFDYLNSGRMYSGKYFYQTPPINVSEHTWEEFMEDFKKNNPEVILIPYDKYNDTTRIASYLDTETTHGNFHKEVLGSTEAPLRVYRRK